MFDYDKASAADPMGFAEIPISGLPENKEIWIKKKLQDGEVISVVSVCHCCAKSQLELVCRVKLF
jgi:hypothetical protein